ncbi:apolipoprotein N-acyltransferase [Micrococcales bacterium KH10]|nr:apolipoprotein N-acyltransferase [Micrococcales bacterium KH10]
MPSVEAFTASDSTPVASRLHWRSSQSLLFRLILGVAGGLILDLAFPAVGWWPCAIIGTALIIAALDGQTVWRSILIGFTASLVFYLVHIYWATLYLGPIPWVALSLSQALIFAAIAAGWSVSIRLLHRQFSGIAGRFVAYPLIVASWWLVRETVASSWPYGGFSWARLSFSQSEGWFAPTLSWWGAPGLSFAIAALAALVYQWAKSLCTHMILQRKAGTQDGSTRERPTPRRQLTIRICAIGWMTVIVAMMLVPVFPQRSEGMLRVAAVQGAGPAGYFSERERGDLLAAQLAATAEHVPEQVDLVIWPEDGTDIDPLRDESTRKIFTDLTDSLQAPVTFGTITHRDGKYYNSSLLWPVGAQQPSAIYDKLHPVPFGEYVPHREFYSRIVPDLIGMVGRHYEFGQRSPVMAVGDGATIGVAICFDIAYDDVAQRIVRDGGQLIVAQSNNGDFGRTDESAQQLAMARVRAIETGRDLVNISTVGISAIIRADGSTAAELPWYEPGAMIQDIHLSTTVTPAMTVGPAIIWLSIVVAFGSVVVLGIRQRRITSSSREL